MSKAKSPIKLLDAKIRTVSVHETSSLRMAAGNEKHLTKVIEEGKLKEWVGIGWVEETEPLTLNQALTYPWVVYE